MADRVRAPAASPLPPVARNAHGHGAAAHRGRRRLPASRSGPQFNHVPAVRVRRRMMGLALGSGRRRRVRTPTLLQSDQTECGAVSLGIVLAFFGRWVPREQLRAACAVSRDGSSGADISRAAREFGLEAKGWRREPRSSNGIECRSSSFWEFQPLPGPGGLRPRSLLPQ